MGLATYLIFLFFIHLSLLNSCESKVCQKPFKCGGFSMDFPFSDIKDSGCGLVMVDGCNSQNPKILARDGFAYFIKEVISPFKIKVYDHELQFSLETKSTCYTLRNVSFKFFPNLTIFNCYNMSDSEEKLFRNYDCQECGISNLYYNSSSTDVPPIRQEKCLVIQLPVKSNRDSTKLLDLLTANFTVEWSVSEACLKCYNGGGQCLTDNQNEFYCKQDDKPVVQPNAQISVQKSGADKRPVKIILSISLSGAGFLLLLSFSYIIWQQKKNNSGSILLARKISSNHSSKSDIEDGGSFFGIPVFSYAELEEATNNFDPCKELGDGGFGTVYYGKLQDGREVAIKRLYENNYKRVEHFINEIKILTSLRHPNLVSLYGCTSRRSRELLLVYEYISNGTVADHLYEDRANEALLTWPIRMKIAIETATALAYLHKSDIIHRDVKTNNILLDTNYSVKVADFGISRLFPDNVTHISTTPQGTPGYVDPEYHQCYQLTDKSDVYSFGVVLIELISSMLAVDVTRHKHEINLANLALNRIQRCAFDELIDPSIGYGSDPEVTRMTTTVAELAFRCLQLEKDLRPSMNEVVTFLKDIKGGEDCDHINIPGKIVPSPETDDFVLLKNKSPSTTVTDTWFSSDSNTLSSVGDQAGCGLIKVDGCGSDEHPRILVKEGYGYYIVEKVSTNKFKINSSEIQVPLDNKRCYTFRNVSLPQSPSLSFTFSPNLTIFTCYNNSGNNEQLDEHFKKYEKQECEISKLYYNSSWTGVPRIEKSTLPQGCEVTQLPVKPYRDSDELFDLLAANFTLEFSVSEDCLKCYREGGQCLADNQNAFYCKPDIKQDIKKDKRKLKLALYICIPGIALLLLFSIAYIIRLRKKKSSGNFLLARNISYNPSSKSDIEDGGSYFGIPVFSYAELEEATNNFDPSKELGDGGFGTVYYGKLRDGREVAIKRLYEHNYKRVEHFINEIKILTTLRHPNLVSLYGCTSRRSRELLLVYEYISNGTVADHLHEEMAKEATLTWPIRMKIAIETATALAYLHKSDIIHRDVKTNNILLDTNYSVKVADFGISRLFPDNVTHISTAPQGTPGYVDPEYHQCYQLTDKSDVYSFGVVLIELISSMPAVDVTRHRHEINLANLALNRIQRSAFDELIDPSIGYGSDPEVTRMTTTVAELAFRCLQLEKDLRPSMDEVVTFLKDIKGGEDCDRINGFVVLKDKSSPTTVTDTWASSESNTLSSVG